IIPAIIIELIAEAIVKTYAWLPIYYTFLKAFVVAAFVEEGLKLFIVKKFAYNDVHFDEVMDGIVYAVVASLGFACFENVLYVVGSGWMVALLRAFTAVPLHAIAAGIMGYYIGKAKFAESQSEEKSLITKGFIYAVIFHGIYDFIIFNIPQFGDLSGLLVIPLLIWGFVFLRKKIKSAVSEDIEMGRTVETDYNDVVVPKFASGNSIDYNSMSREELRRIIQNDREGFRKEKKEEENRSEEDTGASSE
ncbi:MAG: PrsW family glutamic-type intramembrane protease, partial [Bacteroidota bacterium]